MLAEPPDTAVLDPCRKERGSAELDDERDVSTLLFDREMAGNGWGVCCSATTGLSLYLEGCFGGSSLLPEAGLLIAKLGLEACEIGADELPGLRKADETVARSWLEVSVSALAGGVHMNELRNDFACLVSVMRKELLDDVEERLDADASGLLSCSGPEEAERLELDLLGSEGRSMADPDELAEPAGRGKRDGVARWPSSLRLVGVGAPLGEESTGDANLEAAEVPLWLRSFCELSF